MREFRKHVWTSLIVLAVTATLCVMIADEVNPPNAFDLTKEELAVLDSVKVLVGMCRYPNRPSVTPAHVANTVDDVEEWMPWVVSKDAERGFGNAEFHWKLAKLTGQMGEGLEANRAALVSVVGPKGFAMLRDAHIDLAYFQFSGEVPRGNGGK